MEAITDPADLRICFVNNALYPGGAETLLVDLSCAIATRGPQVALVNIWRDPENASNVAQQFRAALARAGVQVFDLERRPASYHPNVFLRYIRALKTFQPHVVSAHCLHPELLAMLGRPFWRSARYLRTIQNVEYTNHHDHPFLWRMLARTFDLTLAGSADCAEAHAKYCPEAAPARIIWDGRDLSVFREWSLHRQEARKGLGLLSSARVIVTTGRLEWRKNHSLMLRAFARLHGPWTALICGIGSLQGELQALASSLGIADRVRFLGAVSDVGEALAAGDVFVMTAHFEGLGLSAIEAAATGLPVVATNVRGLRHIVHHGVTGFLVPPGDIQGVADALQRLLDDPALAIRFGQAGQEDVLKRFDIRACAQAYVDVSLELLAMGGCRHPNRRR
ncbi:MAG: glycosyltransferase [Candidatus Zipacnadales bacterium]